MTFEVITYEEDRLRFFIKQRELAEKRYKRTKKKVNNSDLSYQEIDLLMSEAGWELSFYDDVVRMLTEKLSEKKRIKEMVCDSDV